MQNLLNSKAALLGAATLVLMLQGTTQAQTTSANAVKSALKWSEKTCFCNAVRFDQNQNTTNISNFPTGLSFNVLVVSAANRGDCRNTCGPLFDANANQIANAACAANMPNGSDVRAISHVSSMNNADQARRRRLKITYGQTCPPTWMSNTTNVVGGVTTDGRCKKEFAIGSTNPPISTPMTPPADGTPIGNWGFYWNGALVAYGTPVNGGAAQAPSTGNPKICTLETW